MDNALVTVICLCHNQARFVEEAIQSVFRQTYPRVELIVVDDASTDGSVGVIEKCLATHPDVAFLRLTENAGNCRAFNQALSRARGAYIIDLAADDVLMPDRVLRGVEALQKAGDAYGVNFTDAAWVDEGGGHLYDHSDRFPHDTIPEGDVYRDVIARFFICSPTVMFRRAVIDALEGYDESLAYEDFDFWVRSSRTFLYCYTPVSLVKKRVVRKSMSARQFSIGSAQLHSTYRVCEKILSLNRTTAEQGALRGRILYEMRVALRLLHFPVLFNYLTLYRRNQRMRY